MNESYVTAAYLRISSDDGLHGDSQSIEGQRALVHEFIGAHPELRKGSVLEFFDDGYSGTNFNRPGIAELLRRAQSGEVHCIVVKDFSRFGRNYIEVGDYIEQVFPFLRIRFISVNDAFDSETQGYSAGDVGIAFKHLCNDYYCKDLSRKVKSGYRTRWESGKYLASYSVYGYKKSDEDRYRLAVDEATAPIVLRIFSMALAGSKPSQIAVALNTDGVPTPLETLSEKKGVQTWSKLRPMWTDTEINRILRDLRYTGVMTNGMYGVEKVGGRQARRKPQSEWYITPDTHEALVSHDDFERAQLCIRKIKSSGVKRGPRVPAPYSLPVKVRCGGCGHAMVKNNAKVMAYYCRHRRLMPDGECFEGRIEVEALKEVLLTTIGRLQQALIQRKKAAAEKPAEPGMDYEKRIAVLQRGVDRLTREKLALFDAYSDGEIDQSQYTTLQQSFDGKAQSLLEKIGRLEQERQARLPTPVNLPHAYDVLMDESAPLEYSNELISELVERIVVHTDGQVEIVMKFADEMSACIDGEKEMHNG